MGWITDLLKEIPLSAILKEKLEDLETQHQALKSERDDLHRQLEHAKKEIQASEQKLKKTEKRYDLHETEIEILKLLAKISNREHGRGSADFIANHLKV